MSHTVEYSHASQPSTDTQEEFLPTEMGAVSRSVPNGPVHSVKPAAREMDGSGIDCGAMGTVSILSGFLESCDASGLCVASTASGMFLQQPGVVDLLSPRAIPPTPNKSEEDGGPQKSAKGLGCGGGRFDL